MKLSQSFKLYIYYPSFLIIIINMSRYQHGYPRPSLAISPYRPFLPARPQGYILYRHRAGVCRFTLVVLPLLVHVSGVDCLPMVWETWFQSQFASYHRFLKWYLVPLCLTLSNIRYVSRVK